MCRVEFRRRLYIEALLARWTSLLACRLLPGLATRLWLRFVKGTAKHRMADEEKTVKPEGDKPGLSSTEAGTEPPVKEASAGEADKPKLSEQAEPIAKDAAAQPPPPATEKPATPPGAPATDKPAPPKAPAAGHAAPPKAPPRKGPVITAEIGADPLIDLVKERFGESVTEAVATLGQQIIRVKKDSLVQLCRFLHDDERALFDMCTDLTAVHWPDRKGEEFDVVVLLYSVPKNRRLRIKVSVADGESCPTLTRIWAGADWMEREAYDMFGLKFDGHPDLRRILLPEDWPGHPLRKEYPIEYRDNEWTDKHLEYRDVHYDTSLIDVKYAERR